MMPEFDQGEVPVDFNQLCDAAVEDEDLMRELVKIYLSETENILEDLKKAVAEADAAGIYKFAHKIVGASLTCGMREIIPWLRRLEEIGRTGEIAEAKKTLESAIQAFEKIKSFLSEKKFI